MELEVTKKAKRWNVQRIDHSLAGSWGDEEQNALCLDSSGHDQVLQQDGPVGLCHGQKR